MHSTALFEVAIQVVCFYLFGSEMILDENMISYELHP